MAQAFYECEKDYGKEHQKYIYKDSYEPNISIVIQDSNSPDGKRIYYNWIMNRIGSQIYPDESAYDNIPKDDKDCKGKMFKLSIGGHATSVVCTWDGEKRFYDNQDIDEKTSYHIISKKITIKQFIEDKKPKEVFMYDIPASLSSE